MRFDFRHFLDWVRSTFLRTLRASMRCTARVALLQLGKSFQWTPFYVVLYTKMEKARMWEYEIVILFFCVNLGSKNCVVFTILSLPPRLMFNLLMCSAGCSICACAHVVSHRW